MPPRDESEPRGVVRTILRALFATRLGRWCIAGVTIASVEQLGIVRLSEQPRRWAVLLIVIGVLLAVRVGAQHWLGYTRQGGDIGRRLCRLVRAETALAGYLVAVGTAMRAAPDPVVEFWLAGLGYVALLYIGGLLVADAAEIGLRSVSAAVLESRTARDWRRALNSWRAPKTIPSLPGVEPSLAVLHSTAPRHRSSAAMMILAFGVFFVAIANAGTATRHAAGLAGLSDERAPATDAPTTGGRAPTPIAKSARTAPPSSAADEPHPPTYAQLCGTTVEPGDGAPEPQGTRLRELWLGGTSTAGAGANVAGCAGPARETRNSSGIWYVTGRCGGGVQGLGVADATSASLLLGGAARFALIKAEAGSLLGASRRTALASGDFYLVYTTVGTYVLIRSRVTAARSAPAPTTLCAPSPAAGEPYSVIPPGLLDAWLRRARTQWLWPEELPTRGRARRFAFRTTPDGPITASAYCESESSCQMTGGVASTSAAREPITPEKLAALAP